MGDIQNYFVTHVRTIILVVSALPFVFWIRGILKGSKNDILAGFIILMAVLLIHLFSSRSSGVFTTIGGILFLFGVATLIAGNFSSPECPIKPKDLSAIGLLFVFLGFCASLML